jgi:Holliday junction DNA helicase RuvA
MLSRASSREIASYLRTGDEKGLARLPGIGKKSAARLVVELGQRVPAAGGGEGLTGAMAGPAPEGLAAALAVLGAMGLAPARAEQALLRARQADAGIDQDIEGWIKGALRHL